MIFPLFLSFFDALPRISDSAYLPTDQDILRTRIRSTGIREERFEIEGTKLLVVDVGGQRSERKKWMHLFEDTKLVIFVAAVSEFDQVRDTGLALGLRARADLSCATGLVRRRIATSHLGNSDAVGVDRKQLVAKARIIRAIPQQKRYPRREAPSQPDIFQRTVARLSRTIRRHRVDQALFPRQVHCAPSQYGKVTLHVVHFRKTSALSSSRLEYAWLISISLTDRRLTRR